MLYARTFVGALVATALLGHPAYAERRSEAVCYLKRETRNILTQGDRIKGEAGLMRSESARLRREAAILLTSAAQLDESWEKATRMAPGKFVDYPGRDRSQKIMRSDADRESRDAEGLIQEGARLDGEAVRLWELAAEIDPSAQNELLKRMQACCKSHSLEFLRQEIVKLARSLGANYQPSR